MTECLRGVARLCALIPVVLLGEDAEIVGEAERPLERLATLLATADDLAVERTSPHAVKFPVEPGALACDEAAARADSGGGPDLLPSEPGSRGR